MSACRRDQHAALPAPKQALHPAMKSVTSPSQRQPPRQPTSPTSYFLPCSAALIISESCFPCICTFYGAAALPLQSSFPPSPTTPAPAPSHSPPAPPPP